MALRTFNFSSQFYMKKIYLNHGWKMNIFVKFWSHLTHFKTRTNFNKYRHQLGREDRKLFLEDDYDFIGSIYHSDKIESSGAGGIVCTGLSLVCLALSWRDTPDCYKH